MMTMRSSGQALVKLLAGVGPHSERPCLGPVAAQLVAAVRLGGVQRGPLVALDAATRL